MGLDSSYQGQRFVTAELFIAVGGNRLPYITLP